MNVLVTGGAGFVGSHLVERLAKNPKNEIKIVDMLRTGRREFVDELLGKHKNVSFEQADLSDIDALQAAMRGQDFVYHLAANADVRGGIQDTEIDLKANVVLTRNVLEAMRLNSVKKIVLFSTTQVYGEAKVLPTPEDYSPMLPTNIYGASKIAAEAYTIAFANCFGMTAYIFRPVNIVGSRGTHGVIGDFVKKLSENPKKLHILGDGKQQKSYIHVSDLLDGIEVAVAKSKERVNIYNLGNDDWLSVTRLAEIITEEMKLKNVEFEYSGGDRGWVGDVPKVLISTDRLKALGWKPRMNSEQAVREAARAAIAEFKLKLRV